MNTHADKPTAFYPVDVVLQNIENQQRNAHKQPYTLRFFNTPLTLILESLCVT